MSRRALTLPLRLASSTRPASNQWVCRRCLATQANSAAVTPQIPDEMYQRSSISQHTDAVESSSQEQEPADYSPTLPVSQRNYPLCKADRSLKKPLPHPIPIQYLQHSSTQTLSDAEKTQREKTVPHKQLVGVVVSAGKMAKTVKVRIPGQKWEKRIGKYFASHTNHLVHDPNSSLVVGDVVSLHRLRVSTAVHHVVASIVAPFGTPVDQRKPIPTPDERLAAYKTQRFEKLKRRALRRDAAKGDADAIRELRSMGLDPGQGAEAGVGKKEAAGSGATTALGEKGQKLPEGVLPGGQHVVGNPGTRAKRNRDRALRLQEMAAGHLRQAREREAEARGEGVSADPAAGSTITPGR